MLVIRLYHVYSSTNARLPPPTYPSKPKCSSASNMSIQAFDTHLPPPLSPFKSKCSLSASTMSIQAGTLVSHLCCHHLSLNTHHLPPPCLFEHKCLSSTSTAPFEPKRSSSASTIYSSANACLPPLPGPCHLEHYVVYIWYCCSLQNIYIVLPLILNDWSVR